MVVLLLLGGGGGGKWSGVNDSLIAMIRRPLLKLLTARVIGL